MTRSFRKNPFSGYTKAESDKADKKIFHGRMRAKEREALHHGKEIIPADKESGNPWAWDKDGKGRFDPKQHPSLMRK